MFLRYVYTILALIFLCVSAWNVRDALKDRAALIRNNYNGVHMQRVMGSILIDVLVSIGLGTFSFLGIAVIMWASNPPPGQPPSNLSIIFNSGIVMIECCMLGIAFVTRWLRSSLVLFMDKAENNHGA